MEDAKKTRYKVLRRPPVPVPARALTGPRGRSARPIRASIELLHLLHVGVRHSCTYTSQPLSCRCMLYHGYHLDSHQTSWMTFTLNLSAVADIGIERLSSQGWGFCSLAWVLV